MIFKKKKNCPPAGFEPTTSSVALPIELYGCGFRWNMLLEFSPLLRQPAAECNLITAFTRNDKLEAGG